MFPDGAVEPGVFPDGAVDPGVFPDGAVESGVFPDGAVEAGVFPDGAVESGVFPDGAVEADVFPDGAVEAGGSLEGDASEDGGTGMWVCSKVETSLTGVAVTGTFGGAGVAETSMMGSTSGVWGISCVTNGSSSGEMLSNWGSASEVVCPSKIAMGMPLFHNFCEVCVDEDGGMKGGVQSHHAMIPKIAPWMRRLAGI